MASGISCAGCRAEYADLDKRGNVKLSTKIKVAKTDRKGTKAGQVAARMNATLEAYWRGSVGRQHADAVRPISTQ